MGLNPHDVGLRLQMIVPGQETVQLFIRQPGAVPDAFTSYTIAGVRRRPVKRRLATADRSALSVVERDFDFYRPAMDNAGVPADLVPRAKDYLTDSHGVSWTIITDDAKNLESWIKVTAIQNV